MEEERGVARQRRVGWTIKPCGQMGKVGKKRRRGMAMVAPSPREKRREKELLLHHLDPEGAPWGQPSETRSL